MWKPDFYKSIFRRASAQRITTEEYRQMMDHVEHCRSCGSTQAEFMSMLEVLPKSELKADQARIRQHLNKGGLGERFRERARLAGIDLSSSETSSSFRAPSRSAIQWSMASAAAAIVLVIGIQHLHLAKQFQPTSASAAKMANSVKIPDDAATRLQARLAELQSAAGDSKRAIAELREQNSDVLAQIALMNKELNTRQGENQALKQSLAHLREVNSQQSAQNETTAQILARTQTELDETRTHSRQMESDAAAAKSEVSVLAQQLSSHSATIAHDRELLAAGRDITDLMGARNLHIIDVRDADGKGKNKRSFGRIFYTEGKSLIFYAYDLDNGKPAIANSSYEVWGERLGEPTSVRNLGILFTDNKDQKRWALTVDDPQQLAEIDSVFVTLEPHKGASKPLGGKILFAFLGGKANHP